MESVISKINIVEFVRYICWKKNINISELVSEFRVSPICLYGISSLKFNANLYKPTKITIFKLVDKLNLTSEEFRFLFILYNSINYKEPLKVESMDDIYRNWITEYDRQKYEKLEAELLLILTDSENEAYKFMKNYKSYKTFNKKVKNNPILETSREYVFQSKILEIVSVVEKDLFKIILENKHFGVGDGCLTVSKKLVRVQEEPIQTKNGWLYTFKQVIDPDINCTNNELITKEDFKKGERIWWLVTYFEEETETVRKNIVQVGDEPNPDVDLARVDDEPESVDYTEKTEAFKTDSNKPDMSLFPMSVIENVVRVFESGLKKYPRDNWKGLEKERVMNALKRHLIQIETEEIDKESNLPHIDHICCNAVMLVYLNNQNQ